jgi:hypothetical protein
MYDERNNNSYGNGYGNSLRKEVTVFREDITSNALLSMRIQMSPKNKSHEKRFFAYLNASPQAPAGNGETTYLVVRPCMISFRLGLIGLAEFAYAILGAAGNNQQKKESWIHWADASKAKVNGEAKGGSKDIKSLRVESDVDNKNGANIVNITFSQTVSGNEAQEYERSEKGRQFFSQHPRIKKDNAGNYKHFVTVTLSKYAARAFAQAVLVYVEKTRQVEMDVDYRTALGTHDKSEEYLASLNSAIQQLTQEVRQIGSRDKLEIKQLLKEVKQIGSRLETKQLDINPSSQSSPDNESSPPQEQAPTPNTQKNAPPQPVCDTQNYSQGQYTPKQYGNWRENPSPKRYAPF